MTAALFEKQNAFRILIQKSADPSLKNNGGFSLLHVAAGVEIHPLSTSCYHSVLTLIQGVMMALLH